jgi:mycothiol synthase
VIESVDAVPISDITAVLRVADAATSDDGVGPLSEQVLLRLQATTSDVHHFLARDPHGRLRGYAQIEARPGGSGTAELVVAPTERRQGIGRALLAELQRFAPAGLHLWAHGDLPAAAGLAAAIGYRRSRVLLQLRRSLREPLPKPHWPAGIEVRTFVPGADELPWLKVNNAAFATHPEQGRWTRRDLEQREAQPWFDPAGFFLAERGSELIGFHWTKIHRDETPPVGEVYVVGVRPTDSGHALGPALTLAGLQHLRDLGLEQVLLYVDESNTPAMKTYERLGFTRWETDVLYARA